MQAQRAMMTTRAMAPLKVELRSAKLTLCAQVGKYQRELTSLWVWRTPSTTVRSTTSVPMTAVFMGLGYFRHAA